MPHLVVEYTDNIRSAAGIKAFLRKANRVLLDQDGIFPTGAIRSRAIELHDYVVADDTADDAFVHATLKFGAGRTAAQKKKVGDELFAMMKAHFEELFAARSLALSLELYEFDESGTYKHNNIHARYRTPSGANRT
jgi:5-carboxymethyl-2-hydroxymuconate isomerase